jgi:hypothetical protein
MTGAYQKAGQYLRRSFKRDSLHSLSLVKCLSGSFIDRSTSGANMTPTFLGIDISKKDFHVVLLKQERGSTTKKFTNNTEGFESLNNWLKKQGVEELHACMEATSN